ncbi:MAG: hypothetical protein HOL07_08670 [Rhodospirillaceae bacterium]|nr:hypothetical protein [Rhodospirillaceae bacterium]MBT3810566.1 hypothetical protein [Rhodospirillaceae bacterium]MBT3929942.1 hypothetical protein [Rhodospirillaceae bacterium]MBT4773127.1 hypothetical protein [Rhodospirillaceae bacterium]MBT5358411.1 hypothetical protein [Rhodospirillaceae bacterium]
MNEPNTMPVGLTGLNLGKALSMSAIRRLKVKAAFLLVGGLCLLAALAVSAPAAAQQSTVSPAWIVVQISGEVLVRPASQGQTETAWQTLEQGAQIVRASEIETGPNGLARLSRGEDIIRIMPA